MKVKCQVKADEKIAKVIEEFLPSLWAQHEFDKEIATMPSKEVRRSNRQGVQLCRPAEDYSCPRPPQLYQSALRGQGVCSTWRCSG